MNLFFPVWVLPKMATLFSSKQSRSPADVIFVNGDIYPGAPHLAIEFSAGKSQGKPSLPTSGRAQALAVAGGNIIAAGTNEDIQKLKGPKTQVIDLGGHFVMAGFNDAHV